MKQVLSIVLMFALFSCKGNATTSTEQEQKEIPVGVQVLQQGQTYDLKKAPGHLVVIDFNAIWCAPCMQFTPIFEEAAQKYAGKVEFISVDVDKHQKLAQQLGITSIPFLLFIQPDGKFNSWVGFLPQTEFEKAIDQFLGVDKNE
ncbi:MAG: redoxin family protein [Muribaculaceae bacterium]|nr:redoxin family protein [Muribaculaceae bacterium]